MTGAPGAFALALVLAARAARADDSAAPPPDPDPGAAASTTPVPSKARELAARGRAAHDAGDYRAAIAAFQEAYVIAPSPALLFNLAQAYRLLGDCPDAALMYRRFIASDPSPEARAIAEGHLAATESCPVPAPRPVRPRPRPIAPAPPATPPTLSPAAVASAPRPRGHGASVIGTPRDPYAAPARGPSRTARIEQDAGIALAIGGTVALGAAAYFAIEAHGAASDVSDAYAHGAKWKDVAATDARGERDATRAQIFGIGGGVALAAGATLYVVGRRTEHPSPLAIAPARGGARVSMSWQF